mmetsp:Transcript_3995/g.10988  ORF Transcript_3995/g.10988 Transcript_3995/m.10988 type:complete len:301 (+) Transcript_3995:787-1689(+)
MFKWPSEMPHERRDSTARSVHFDAHTVQIAFHSASTPPSPSPANAAILRSSSSCSSSGHTSSSAITARALLSASRRVFASFAAVAAPSAASSARFASGSRSSTRSKHPNGSDTERGTSASSSAACRASSAKFAPFPPTTPRLYSSGIITHALLRATARSATTFFFCALPLPFPPLPPFAEEFLVLLLLVLLPAEREDVPTSSRSTTTSSSQISTRTAALPTSSTRRAHTSSSAIDASSVPVLRARMAMWLSRSTGVRVITATIPSGTSSSPPSLSDNSTVACANDSPCSSASADSLSAPA